VRFRSGHDDDGGCSIVNAGRVACGDGAILLEGGLEGAESFDGGVFADGLVVIEEGGRLTFSLRRNFNGDDFGGEAAFSPGRFGFFVGEQGEAILIFAGDVVLFRDELGGVTHVEVVVDVPEAVVDHGVDCGGIAHAEAAARLWEQVGSIGHRLHAAGDDDVRIAGLDGLRGEGDGTKTGATDHVDGEGADLGRESAEDRGLARGILSEAGRDDVAHDALVDLLGTKLRALDGFVDDDCAEARCGDVGERTLKFSDRRADAGDDYDLIHCFTLHDSMLEAAIRIQRKITESEGRMHDLAPETTAGQTIVGPQRRAGAAVAPWWHTALIVLLLVGTSLLGARAAHRGEAGAHHVYRYAFGIGAEWGLLLLTWWGLRLKRVGMAELLGFRRGFQALAEDVAAAAVFWIAAAIILAAIALVLKATGLSAPQKTLMALAPSTPLELLIWMVLSMSAGFCEEFVFRGYFLRQFGSVGAGVWLGVLCSSLLFGVSHGYEGAAGMIAITAYGAMFCTLALVTKSLRPGMIAHAWHDIFSGVMLMMVRHFHLL